MLILAGVAVVPCALVVVAVCVGALASVSVGARAWLVLAVDAISCVRSCGRLSVAVRVGVSVVGVLLRCACPMLGPLRRVRIAVCVA